MDLLTNLTHWVDTFVTWITTVGPEGYPWSIDFIVRAFLAVVLVSLISGAVGSLVVSNRMAFFSDALAHCAFAGVAMGFLMGLAAGTEKEESFLQVQLPLTM